MAVVEALVADWEEGVREDEAPFERPLKVRGGEEDKWRAATSACFEAEKKKTCRI